MSRQLFTLLFIVLAGITSVLAFKIGVSIRCWSCNSKGKPDNSTNVRWQRTKCKLLQAKAHYGEWKPDDVCACVTRVNLDGKISKFGYCKREDDTYRHTPKRETCPDPDMKDWNPDDPETRCECKTDFCNN